VNIHSLLDRLIRPFRARRMARFLEVIAPCAGETILDVGGTPFNWRLIGYEHEVRMLNLASDLAERRDTADLPANLSFVAGDGTALQFPDGAFEIAFSNSVIEHVGSFEKQRAFANEVRRVGSKLWIQTPARSFFFEPHYLAPFVHWMPRSLQKRILRNLSVWGLLARPSQRQVDACVDSTRLLSFDEMRELFPDCQVVRERFLFMTKSLLAIRR
jgi:hypothetical protein